MIQANIGGSIGYDMKARLFTSYGGGGSGQALHVGDLANTRPQASAVCTGNFGTTNNYAAQNLSINYLDSGHNQNTEITYKLQLASYSTYTIYLNRTGGDLISAGSYDARTASSIILMEISD